MVEKVSNRDPLASCARVSKVADVKPCLYLLQWTMALVTELVSYNQLKFDIFPCEIDEVFYRKETLLAGRLAAAGAEAQSLEAGQPFQLFVQSITQHLCNITCG